MRTPARVPRSSSPPPRCAGVDRRSPPSRPPVYERLPPHRGVSTRPREPTSLKTYPALPNPPDHSIPTRPHPPAVTPCPLSPVASPRRNRGLHRPLRHDLRLNRANKYNPRPNPYTPNKIN
ncbi:hypothetical protein WJX74_009846 [Apatococcus lobatus]|uniref:Uncharacterized protein n=1 Tax=Apatococcus lobatus TaxID=904363 RepID=A0AAW1R225_9CHLO